jgi:hypothetical protein
LHTKKKTETSRIIYFGNESSWDNPKYEAMILDNWGRIPPWRGICSPIIEPSSQIHHPWV